MFFLADFSKKTKKSKLVKVKINPPRQSIELPNIANAAATGGTLGALGGTLAGGSRKANIIGAGAGLAAGTGAGLISQLIKKNQSK